MSNESTSATKKGLAVARRLLIAGLAGLLIFYHSYTLYELYLGGGASPATTFDYIQSPLRLIIVVSLLCVVSGARWALWGMWLGITALVATQYWAHFGNLPVEFTKGRHALSYLKGFIFPTLITLAFQSSSTTNKANATSE